MNQITLTDNELYHQRLHVRDRFELAIANTDIEFKQHTQDT